MDVHSLKRDAALIHKAYTVTPEGAVVTNRQMEVHLPKRFINNGMAVITEKVTTAAVLGLVIPGVAYAPLVAVLSVTLLPLSNREITVDGEQYLVLEFEEGDILIENINVLQETSDAYTFHMEFENYARKPWYLNKDDLSSMYDNSAAESGMKVGTSPQVVRVFHSLMFRDPTNLENPYRNSKAMLEGKEPIIVGLNNSPLLADGMFAKLMGGYMRDNTVAAIVNQDTKVTVQEKIMKGDPI